MTKVNNHLDPEKENGITKIPKNENRHGVGNDYDLKESPARKAVKKLPEETEEVVLFKTIANLEAVEELQKYVLFREEGPDNRNIDKIEEYEDRSRFSYTMTEGELLSFDPKLMKLFERTIDKIAEEKINEEKYVRYPIVHRTNYASKDRKSILQSKIYITDSEVEEELKETIKGFTNGGFEAAKDEESERKYNRGEIIKLQEQEIDPILIKDDELRPGKEELQKYADFLSPVVEIRDADSGRWYN